MQPNAKEIARFIDHTILKPNATSDQIRQACQEALTYGFFGVCVNSCWLPLVREHLNYSPVVPVVVVGFPLGAMSTESKAAEASWCVAHGAKELDMVLNIGWLKSQDYKRVQQDIEAVVKASQEAQVKVILETGLLTREEKIKACKLAVDGGAHFVKTCTGFGGGAATLEDIQLLRQSVGPKVGVKASGGILNLAFAQELLAAGANRLGTSSGVAILQGLTTQGGY